MSEKWEKIYTAPHRFEPEPPGTPFGVIPAKNRGAVPTADGLRWAKITCIYASVETRHDPF